MKFKNFEKFRISQVANFIKNDIVHKKSFREEGDLCCKYTVN